MYKRQLKAIRHLEKGRVVIFGAGAGMPYFSTDTVSIHRSLEIHCDEVLMGKNGVDGVYTADPRKDENAKRFATLSYNRCLLYTSNGQRTSRKPDVIPSRLAPNIRSSCLSWVNPSAPLWGRT